jgi:hypothetical protein
MKVLSVLMLSVFAVLGVFPVQAKAVEVSPRIGIEIGHYDVVVDSGLNGGLTAGVTVSFPYVYTDLGLETMSFSVRDPANIGLRTNMVDGYRSEATLTVGIPVWQSLSVFGGYRYVVYGTKLINSNSATMDGGFLGVALNNLHMGESTKDIFSFAFAVQPTTYKAKSGSYGEETDVGASIKLGYRRAGTPHSFGLRYQAFGGDKSYDEYLTSLQYSYLF